MKGDIIPISALIMGTRCLNLLKISIVSLHFHGNRYFMSPYLIVPFYFGDLILDIPPHMAMQIKFDAALGTDEVFAFAQVFKAMFVAAAAERAGNGKLISLHGYLLWQYTVYSSSFGKANRMQISPVCGPFFLTDIRAEHKIISYQRPCLS